MTLRIRMWALAPVLALGAVAAPAAGQDERPPVRVYHDALYVPHVFADEDAGVFRGLGYTQVHDFPVATLANLWCATGRFAEVAGELALPRDERMRLWGFDRRAHELATDPAELDPTVRAWLQAYVDGVNAGRRAWLEHPAWIQALVGAKDALGFDPVPPWLSPLRVRSDFAARIRRLLEAEVGLEHVLAYGLTLAAGPEFGGAGYSTFTNLWLMRGSERDPATRFLADVHQPLQSFGYRSYLVQLAGPGYDVVGNTVPGFPCVVLGANRTFAFGSMTPPKTPRKLAAAGLPFRIDDATPLTASTWRARLEPDAPARVARGEERLPLVERTVTLRSWDPGTSALVDDPRGPLTLRWVAADGLELPVTEPGPREPLELGGDATIRYEGRTFLGQRSLFETWMRLGTCAHVGAGKGGTRDVLEREWLVTGRGQIALNCDAGGGFEFVWATRAPRLAPKALERWQHDRNATLLDGDDPEQRWLGFATLADMPQGLEQRPRGERPEAWIGCNGSPQALAPSLATLSFDGPPTLWDGEPWTTRRQPRARALFERAAADGKLAPDELERMALDVQDGWCPSGWSWIQALAAAPDAALSPRARGFLEWVDRFRWEGPDGRPGDEPFLAHPLSQVMPFLVLLRDRFEDELVEHRANARALALAFDPLAADVEPARLRDDEELEPVRQALLGAIEWVAELRERTLAAAPGGLRNRAFFERWSAGAGKLGALFPQAWPASLYAHQDDAWGAEAPPPALRWGEVNVYALTPHRLPFDPKLDSPRQVEGWLASIFAPATMDPPLPFFRAQHPVVFPVGGTHESLFQVHREGFLSLAQWLLPRDDGYLALAPVDFGSQVLFSAEMVPDARPRVRVLPALGATEISVDIPGHGARAGDLFAPTARFAQGTWSELVTDEERLKSSAGVRVLELE